MSFLTHLLPVSFKLGIPTVSVNTLGLNGTNQYLRINPLTPNAIAFSVSFYFRANDLSGIQMLMSQFDGGVSAANRRLFYCWLNGSTLEFSVNSDDLSVAPLFKTSILSNTWYHVMFVFDGSDIYLYDDNIQEDTGAFVKTLNTSNIQDLSIGAQWNLSTGNASLNFNGAISHVMIFDYALTPSDRSEIYNGGLAKQSWKYSNSIRDNLILSLPLNDGVATGRAFEDYSGLENNPILIGSPTITVASLDTIPGTVYNSYSFDGSTEYISCGNDASFNTSNVSVSCWVRASDSSTEALISKWGASASNRSWELYKSSGNLNFIVQEQGGGTSTASSALTLSQWIHVVATWNGSLIKLYINGTEVDSVAHSGTLETSTEDLIIGDSSIGGFLLTASLTQAMIFNRGLTQAEVVELYNQNVPLDYSKISTTITDDCVMALALNSNDTSLADLSGNGNSGTGFGGITADGAEIDWE